MKRTQMKFRTNKSRFKKIMELVIGVVVVIVGLSGYGFLQAIRPQKIKTDVTPDDLGWKYEEVILETEDGLNLSAWYVPVETKSEKALVVLHGYPADKANVLYWAQFLQSEYNLLFVDFRYFGESEGSHTTLGSDERKDLIAAVRHLKQRRFEKIGVYGFSLGGAVALMAAAESEDIKAVVADSTFANLDLMASVYYQNYVFLKEPISWLTKMWARLVLGINPDQISPEKFAQSLSIPVLVTHSEGDEMVGFESALRLQQALKSNPKAEFLFFEGGGHGFVENDQVGEYEESVREFLQKSL